MTIRMPPNLVLMLAFMALALIATWIVPAGSYETIPSASGASAVVPGTFRELPDAAPLPPWTLVTVVPRALAQAQGVIFFILLVGGALGVVRRTGAIEAGIGRAITRLAGRQQLLVVCATTLFALLSASFGMASEYIAFAGLLVALCAAMRLDAMTASAMLLVGYGVGYGASTTNPFAVLIAQEIAGVPPGSGLGFRFVVLALALVVGVHHVSRHARRRSDRPASAASPTAQLDDGEPAQEFPPMTRTRIAVLGCLALALAALMAGIVLARWTLPQLSALFLGLGLVVAAVARLPLEEASKAFFSGAARLTGTALLVGFARSIALILEEGQVLHTLIHVVSGPLSHWPPQASAVGMLAIQGLLDVVISSGTGQAFATMPIMAPLADLVGVSRQVSVLAYQFGAGFVDLLTPTNPFLLAILGITGVGYAEWFRFAWPLVAKLMLLGAAAIVVAVQIGL